MKKNQKRRAEGSKVWVRNNDVNTALKIMKRRLRQDGFFEDLERHQFYVKPSQRKRMRKKYK